MSLAFDTPVQRLPGDMHHTWYDERRRQLIAAMLPQPHLGHVLEIAGEAATLSDLLAPRAQQMCRIALAPPTTGHFECLQASYAHVQRLQTAIAQQWPDGCFDHFLVCDVGYYLDAPALHALGRRIEDHSSTHACLLAAHWRHPFAQVVTPAPYVHSLLSRACLWHSLGSYADDNLVIQIWSRDPRSVAQRSTGLA